MDRKAYWNKSYAEYWKRVTTEAEDHNGVISKIKKLSGHDFKAPDMAVFYDLFDRLSYSTGDCLLDYGCGLGRFYPYFKDKVTYYGIDISEAMISSCKETFPESEDFFIEAEGEKLPFEDDKFDIIVCVGVFDACYQEQALKEMFRVLKVGGRLLISGKSDNYFADDEEAMIAEINARKKGHPNYFTDVKGMLSQMEDCAETIMKRFFLRRGDFGQNKYETEIQERFYEWVVIVKKIKAKDGFLTFSDKYSKTFGEKHDEP